MARTRNEVAQELKDLQAQLSAIRARIEKRGAEGKYGKPTGGEEGEIRALEAKIAKAEGQLEVMPEVQESAPSEEGKPAPTSDASDAPPTVDEVPGDPEPKTSEVDEAGNPTGQTLADMIEGLTGILSRSTDLDDTRAAIRDLISLGRNMPQGGRRRNPATGPFMASFTRPAGREKTGIAKASPERMAERAEDRKEKRAANRNKQARSIVALALEKGKGINAAMGQLKDRFGDSFADSWASSNGIRQDDNGQYRATEDVQDGIVRAAGRMTPEDKAARRQQRLDKASVSRMKRVDGADGTKPDGKISPAEEAADRAARDQRMKDRIINLEQTDVNTGERFRPDQDGNGVIDEAERAEQNRRIGNVEPTYISPRDRRRNEAFEGVGLRAPRPGETSARDVIMADSQEELDRKIGEINQKFEDQQADAAAVNERADAFEAQVPGTMEPNPQIPGQSLIVEDAMSRNIDEIMPSILDGTMSPEEGARLLGEFRDGMIGRTDTQTPEKQSRMREAFPIAPSDLSGAEGLTQGPLGDRLGSGPLAPPVAGRPIPETEEQLGGLLGQSQSEIDDMPTPFDRSQREDFPGDNSILNPSIGAQDPIDLLQRQEELKNMAPDPGFGPVSQGGQNNFLRDYFGGGGGGQPAFAQAGMMGQMVPTQLSGGQTIQYYDGMGNPIYG